jgi:murein DD-endopeptidase MepM/ murein hydrolase activator NlpD
LKSNRPRTFARRPRTLVLAAACFAAACSVGTATAAAATVGAAEPVSGTPAASTSATGSDAYASSGGGVTAPGKPEVADVVCLKRCVSGRKATPGAAIAVKGDFLQFATRVVFAGSDGPISSRYTYRSDSRFKALVPRGAVSSRPFVIGTRGQRSNRSPRRLEVLPKSALPTEVFPVRGPHQYWDGFGAGRGHEGMDIGARCGTPMVSALDGRVEHKAYHSAAGNYVVVDTAGTPNDLMYAHLIRPGSVRVGQTVTAGQRIGYVGETGNAQGCHLHFEFWKGDWYGGGHAVDPEPYLRAWDRKS